MAQMHRRVALGEALSGCQDIYIGQGAISAIYLKATKSIGESVIFVHNPVLCR
jgi:hypothetical protein